MYSSPKIISEQISNNAFDFERRAGNGAPKIFIPPLIKADLNKLELGNDIVFEAADDEGNIKSCSGLKYFIEYKIKDPQSIYIFDNHNHAFYFWHLQRYLGNLQDNATLIHIDQHKDTRIPAEFLTPEESQSLNSVYEYTNTILNVGNFIPPAIKTGLIKEVIFIDSTSSLENFDLSKIDHSNIILDIDVDFFAPELDYIGNNLKLKVCREILPLAKVVTFATSPFFIDQQLAIDWTKKILSHQ